MRRQHYLKQNAKNELPQHMIFVDTETKGVQVDNKTQHHYLWFGWAKRVRFRQDRGVPRRTAGWCKFQTAEDFWQWIRNHALARTRTWVFAHNWNFDGGILATGRILPKLGYTCTGYINDKPPFIVRWRSDNHTLLLVDTLNYFAGSLESIGEQIGIPKLPFPEEGSSEDTWDTYCKRDVEVLEKAVLDFRQLVDELDLGNFQRTLASQAFTAYRHRFMNHKILIHDREDCLKLEREAYYGGRTEAFRIGDFSERVWCLDINSMYPYVMALNRYPNIIRGRRYRPSLEDVHELLERYAIVGDCDVSTSEPVFPKRINGRLCFPVGRFRAALSTPEIRHGLSIGVITHVHKLAYYEQEYLFTDFVRELYDLRMKYKAEGNETYSYMVKILMNSLYGKFGQNGMNWQNTHKDLPEFEGIMYEQETPDSPIQKYRWRLGIPQVFAREGESENSLPAISGHVTAYGRMYLWELLQKAGLENVFYTDTDSIICTETGFNRLRDNLDERELGALKVEWKSNGITLYGPKDYRVQGHTKRKGVSSRAIQIASNVFEQDMFRSYDWVLTNGGEGYIPIQRVRKTLSRDYKKGEVKENGTVTPYYLEEW